LKTFEPIGGKTMEINELEETKIDIWVMAELQKLKRGYMTVEEHKLFVDNLIEFLKEL
jgi:hypothetical protein